MLKAEKKEYGKEQFVKAVRKFMEMKKLTHIIVKELIEKIEVYKMQGTGKGRTQKITIHYNFIGTFDVPETKEKKRIVLNTRAGVAVNYVVGKAV